MKKIAMILGGFFALILVAALVIPLVVDVDKYRPQIVDMANQQLNGKLSLGKLSLSLLGQVKVGIAGLNLTDSAGHPVVAVQDAWFHIPLTSVLTGSPMLEFKMDKPDLMIVKSKAGKLNVLSLTKGDQYVGAAAFQTTPAKSSAETAQKTAAKGAPQGTEAEARNHSQPVAASPSSSGSGIALPAMLSRARLGVEISDAHLTYKDESTGLDSKLSGLNLVMKDISVSQPMQIQLWSDLDTKLGGTLLVKGQARLDAEAHPFLTDGKFDHVSVTAKVNADGLEIAAPGTFEKKAGVPANADVAMTVSPREAKIEHFDAKFFNAEIQGSGSVANIAGGAGAPEPVARIALKSNAIELKSWVELVPMLKNFELGGTASLSAEASGPADKMGYEADFKIDGLTAKAPMLKEQPTFDLDAHVVTNKLDRFAFSMKAPGNDLRVTGTVDGFMAPRADFRVVSTGLDLDQLMDMTPSKSSSSAASGASSSSSNASGNTTGAEAPAAAAPEAAARGSSGAASATPGKADFDAMLAPLRANKALKAAAADVTLDLKKVKARGMVMTDMTGKIFLKNLSAGIEAFSMKLWQGTVKASMSADIAPAHPTYQFSAQGSGIDLKEGVSSTVEAFKNTVIGIASFQASGNGSSFNPDAAIANMKAKGGFRVQNAEFTSIDVGKMATDAINHSLESIGNKIAALRGKSLNPPGGSRSMKYELVSANFTISDGVFSMPDFSTKAVPNQGIDLKGATTVGMKDYSLHAPWQVIDTYNMTHAKDLSAPSLGGGQVSNILAQRNQPVQFPVTVGGTLMSPKYSYTEVPGFLMKVALNNMASGTGKAMAAQQAQKILQKAPAPVQKAASGLLKKFLH